MATFDATAVRRSLSGISGILVTPFDQADQPAPALLRPIVNRAVAAGVHVLVANGNTSEYYCLQAHETQKMAEAAGELIGGRVPYIAGVGRSVGEACELARVSRRAGADALMVHQPPDPFAAPRGIVAYLRRIADAAEGLPIVLYLRNETIGMAAIEELCGLPEVIGIKWASPTPLVLAEAMRRTRGLDLAWVGGLAETWAPALYAVGARGFTSGLINVVPERSVAIHAALEANDFALARRLIDAMAPFEELRAQENNGANVTVVKTALHLMGLGCGAARPPSAWPMRGASLDRLKHLLTQWQVDKPV